MKATERNLLFVFDTSVIANSLKRRTFSSVMFKELNLLSEDARVFISSVTKGELSVLQTTSRDKRLLLEILYNIFIEISPATRELTHYYSNLHIQNKKLGLNVGQNDLWIAATANYLNIPLVTCDKDFLRLFENKLMRKKPLYFDPKETK